MSEAVKDEFAGMPDIPQHVYDEIDKGFRKYLFFETIKKGTVGTPAPRATRALTRASWC